VVTGIAKTKLLLSTSSYEKSVIASKVRSLVFLCHLCIYSWLSLCTLSTDLYSCQNGLVWPLGLDPSCKQSLKKARLRHYGLMG